MSEVINIRGAAPCIREFTTTEMQAWPGGDLLLRITGAGLSDGAALVVEETRTGAEWQPVGEPLTAPVAWHERKPRAGTCLRLSFVPPANLSEVHLNVETWRR
jgi:hypothetical protein